MAEDLEPRRPDEGTHDDLLPAPPPSRDLERSEPGGALGPPLPPSQHAPRFRMITGGLVGVAIGALAAAAVLVAGGGPKPGLPWSHWKPPDHDSKKGAEQIAEHVAPAYRLPTGDQLVLVTGGPLKVADLDLPVRIAVSSSTASADAKLINGRSVMYTLCGLGPRCAIAKGKPSNVRFLLLSREALELALYSFRYLDGVKNVVALLPPKLGQKPTNALFFRRGDLKPVLDHPLPATLPSPPPTLNSLDTSPEATLIKRLTDRNLFTYAFQQGQDLSALLVLNRQTG